MDEERDPGELTSLPKFQPMPDLDPDEYRGLRDGIEDNGVRKRVDIDEEGNVIDGHHRVNACEELGKVVPVTVHEGLTEDEKIALAWELNMERRHLEDTEKQDLIEQRLIELEERGVSKTDASLGEELGVDPSWVGKVRRRLVEDGKIGSGPDISNLPQAEKREEVRSHIEKHPNKSNREIATDLGVSHPTVGSVRSEGDQTEVDWDENMRGERMFPFIGSKYTVARWLTSKFPSHETYVEVFGGSASVLYTKPPSQAEVYNDVDEHLVHLLKTIRDSPEDMERMLSDVPYDGDQYDNWIRHWYEGWRPEDPVEKAAVLFYGRFTQHKAKYGEKSGFAYPHSNPDNKLDYEDSRTRISDFADRLDEVRFESRDYTEVLEEYDAEDTLFYLDPPYVEKEQYHAQEEGQFDHDELVDKITDLRGKFILSYGEKLPDGLDHYRRVKMTGVPGERASVEHHIMNFGEDEEAEFVFGKEGWMEAGDALEADW